MGRYAIFNTGFEYKFGFAVQCSSDIQFWGGENKEVREEEECECDGECDWDDGHGYTTNVQCWDAAERPEMLAKLTRMLDFHNIKINWEDFPETTEGTKKLHTWFWDTYVGPACEKLEEIQDKRRKERKAAPGTVKTFGGMETLKQHMEDAAEDRLHPATLFFCYMLGALIVHQLGYKKDLNAGFEM